MVMKDTIYVVIARAEPRTTSRKKISEGSKAVCAAQIKAKAGLFPAKYVNQVEKLKNGCRVVILQGGYVEYRKKYGAVRFVAAGIVKEPARKMQIKDYIGYLELWRTTRRWYKNMPLVKNFTTASIIQYDLKKARKPFPKPRLIIANARTKVIEIKPGTPVYDEIDDWWRRVTKKWHY
jgi:hypothetical protein